MILCKYLKSDGCLNILEAKRLRAANPIDFNDPFELYPGIIGEPDREKIAFYFQNNLRPRLSPDILQRLPNDLTDAAWGRIRQTYKQGLKEEILKSLLYAAKTLRIVCFCDPSKIKDGDDILLWSHYSEGHQGLRIFFETNDIEIQSTNLFPVNYSLERARIDITDPNNDNPKKAYEAVTTTKNESWSYEREIRWIISRQECIEDNGCSYIPLPPKAIRRIDMGCRCDISKKVISLLTTNKEYEHVKLYNALLHEYRFSLNYNEVEIYKGRTGED